MSQHEAEPNPSIADRLATGLDSLVNPQTPPLALEGQVVPTLPPAQKSQDVLQVHKTAFVNGFLSDRLKIQQPYREPVDLRPYSYLPQDFQSPYRPPLPRNPLIPVLSPKWYGEKVLGIKYEQIVNNSFGDPRLTALAIHTYPAASNNSRRLAWEYMNAVNAVDKDPKAKHYALWNAVRSTGVSVGKIVTQAAFLFPFIEGLVDLRHAGRDRKKGFENEANFERRLAFTDFVISLLPIAGVTGFAGGPLGFVTTTVGVGTDLVIQGRYFDPYVQNHNADVREIDMAALHDAFTNKSSPLRRIQKSPGSQDVVDLRNDYAEIMLRLATQGRRNFGLRQGRGPKAMRTNNENIGNFAMRLNSLEDRYQTVKSEKKAESILKDIFSVRRDLAYALELDAIAEEAAKHLAEMADTTNNYVDTYTQNTGQKMPRWEKRAHKAYARYYKYGSRRIKALRDMFPTI